MAAPFQDVVEKGYDPEKIGADLSIGKKHDYTPPAEGRDVIAPVPNIPGRSKDLSGRDYGRIFGSRIAETLSEMDFSGPLDPRLNFAEVVTPVVQFILYNPSDDEVRQSCNSYEYVLPPHDKVYYNGLDAGCCPVFDGLEMLGDKSGKKKYQPLPAIHIVRFLIGSDGRSGPLGVRGIRVLFRDERDTLVKEEARKVYREFKYQACLALKSAQEFMAAKERAGNVPITPPSKRVREAMNFVAEYEGEGQGASPFPCSVCAWPFNNKNDRNAHIEVQHKSVAADMGLLGGREESSEDRRRALVEMDAKLNQTSTAPATPAALSPKKRGRPKKVKEASSAQA